MTDAQSYDGTPDPMVTRPWSLFEIKFDYKFLIDFPFQKNENENIPLSPTVNESSPFQKNYTPSPPHQSSSHWQ